MNFSMDVGNLSFTGDLIHIVGTNIGDRGHNCAAHSQYCGSVLCVDDWVLFRFIPLDAEGLDEDAIEVRRIVQGQVTCCVGFLQRTYVRYFEQYNGKFAQVREIWSANDESATQRSMFHHNHGCCIAGIMGPKKVREGRVNDTSYDNDTPDDDSDDEIDN